MSAVRDQLIALDIQSSMDKWDMLIIRACKADLADKKCEFRLVQIMTRRVKTRRVYIRDADIAEYLMKLVDHYQLSTLSKFTELLLNNYGRDQMFVNTRGPVDMYMAVRRAAILLIATAEATKFPGMRWPTKFKRL